MTSSRIVCSRVSTSALTEVRTNASDTCCRSTSTVAAARYRFGSDRASVTVALATAANTRSASHLRRAHASSARSSFCEGAVRSNDREVISVTCSGHDDDVAGLDAEVLLRRAFAARARHDLLEVVGHLANLVAVAPQHRDPPARGVLTEAAGHRQHVEHGRPAAQLVPAGRFHLADD